MSEIILYLHVLAGIVSIVSSFSTVFESLSKLRSVFWPSIAVVSFSGLGLMFAGASIVRVCTSGIVLAVSLVIIHKYTARKLTTQTTRK